MSTCKRQKTEETGAILPETLTASVILFKVLLQALHQPESVFQPLSLVGFDSVASLSALQVLPCSIGLRELLHTHLPHQIGLNQGSGEVFLHIPLPQCQSDLAHASPAWAWLFALIVQLRCQERRQKGEGDAGLVSPAQQQQTIVWFMLGLLPNEWQRGIENLFASLLRTLTVAVDACVESRGRHTVTDEACGESRDIAFESLLLAQPALQEALQWHPSIATPSSSSSSSFLLMTLLRDVQSIPFPSSSLEQTMWTRQPYQLLVNLCLCFFTRQTRIMITSRQLFGGSFSSMRLILDAAARPHFKRSLQCEYVLFSDNDEQIFRYAPCYFDYDGIDSAIGVFTPSLHQPCQEGLATRMLHEFWRLVSLQRYIVPLALHTQLSASLAPFFLAGLHGQQSEGFHVKTNTALPVALYLQGLAGSGKSSFVQACCHALRQVVRQFAQPRVAVEVVKIPLNAITRDNLSKVLQVQGLSDWSVERMIEQTHVKHGLVILHLEECPRDTGLQDDMCGLIQSMVINHLRRYGDFECHVLYMLTSNYLPSPSLPSLSQLLDLKHVVAQSLVRTLPPFPSPFASSSVSPPSASSLVAVAASAIDVSFFYRYVFIESPGPEHQRLWCYAMLENAICSVVSRHFRHVQVTVPNPLVAASSPSSPDAAILPPVYFSSSATTTCSAKSAGSPSIQSPSLSAHTSTVHLSLPLPTVHSTAKLSNKSMKADGNGDERSEQQLFLLVKLDLILDLEPPVTRDMRILVMWVTSLSFHLGEQLKRALQNLLQHETRSGIDSTATVVSGTGLQHIQICLSADQGMGSKEIMANKKAKDAARATRDQSKGSVAPGVLGECVSSTSRVLLSCTFSSSPSSAHSSPWQLVRLQTSNGFFFFRSQQQQEETAEAMKQAVALLRSGPGGGCHLSSVNEKALDRSAACADEDIVRALSTAVSMQMANFVQPVVIVLLGEADDRLRCIEALLHLARTAALLCVATCKQQGKYEPQLHVASISLLNDDDRTALQGDGTQLRGGLFKLIDSANNAAIERLPQSKKGEGRKEEAFDFVTVAATVSPVGQFILRELLEAGPSKTHCMSLKKDGVMFVLSVEGDEVAPPTVSRAHCIINCSP